VSFLLFSFSGFHVTAGSREKKIIGSVSGLLVLHIHRLAHSGPVVDIGIAA
jgi:hypothetical protein